MFWYNLHKNGNVDLNTKHAGCPVLRGNKWGRFLKIFLPVWITVSLCIFYNV